MRLIWIIVSIVGVCAWPAIIMWEVVKDMSPSDMYSYESVAAQAIEGQPQQKSCSCKIEWNNYALSYWEGAWPFNNCRVGMYKCDPGCEPTDYTPYPTFCAWGREVANVDNGCRLVEQGLEHTKKFPRWGGEYTYHLTWRCCVENPVSGNPVCWDRHTTDTLIEIDTAAQG